MLRHLWLIPILPLLGFLLNGLFGARLLPRRAVALIGCAAVLGSLILSVGAVLDLGPGQRFSQDLFVWLPLGPASAGAGPSLVWGYALDPLSAVMILVVTGIGFLIHVYSVGYMAGEPRAAFARFFSYLNLFMAMMLTLVLAASLPVLFVGWEGVGLCSYLLIGFYYDRMFDETARQSCADAGRKAFITNRVGDAGFLMGALLLFSSTGTFDIQGILGRAGGLEPGVATAAALLLFVGACGKSAQFPLHVWLPDAMAGPTPVSALIHAATMVTAGVYLTCRMAPLFLAAPAAMATVAVVGAVTALFAAVIGCAQNDIKKILAYSTVSQLGYMMLAAGVGAFSAAIFHLMTHAFFKALLFLGAGSVIHALSGEQDIRKMGGLRRLLPVTHATFAVGVLAIAGLPPLAGFFSKDEILWAALSGPGGSAILWAVGVLTAGVTACYMTRLYVLAFAGRPRMADDARRHLHESPLVMTLPLVLLAVGSAIAGFAGVPHALGGDRLPNYLESYLAPVLHTAAAEPVAPGTASTIVGEHAAMLVAFLVSVAGIVLGWALQRGRPVVAGAPGRVSPLARLAGGEFFVDEAIEAIVLRPYRALCRLAAAFDARVVDGLVNAVAVATDLASLALRATQTGYVRNYAFVFFLGTIVILGFALL